MIDYIVWLVSYLLGSIPFGVVFARLRNVDLRQHGSGNIGATNVARVLGNKAGALTLAGDCAKGAAAAALAAHTLDHPSKIAVAGLLAFCGHVFSVFLKFTGGKGVATGLGVFLYLTPQAALGAAGVFVLTFLLTRYVSAGSILAAVALPLLAMGFHAPMPYVAAAAIAALLSIWKHRENVRRLLAGSEARFGKK